MAQQGPQTYDVIVVGTGGIGSAALYHLGKRGLKVMGIDPFPPGHSHGSSFGYTRITRQAYFEHPDYVPLLIRAHELWHELNQISGQSLFHQVGLICMSNRSHSRILPNILKSSQRYHIPTQQLDAHELRKQYSYFNIPDDFFGVFEPGAGYLEVENCVRSHLSLAQQHGAVFLQAQLSDWKEKQHHVEIQTNQGHFLAEKLIIATGAWTQRCLPQFPMKLSVHSAVQFWFETSQKKIARQLPCFAFEIDNQFIYGFPYIEGQGLKVANHAPMEIIPDPDHKPTTYSAKDLDPIQSCIHQHLPHANPRPISHANCMYTMSMDEHFIVDRWWDSDRVFLAAAGNGHAFKFTAVIGEALADLAQTNRTLLPIEFLRFR